MSDRPPEPSDIDWLERVPAAVGAVGSVTAGIGVSCWLLFVRISVWGLPDRADSAEEDPRG